MRSTALPSGHYRDPLEVAIANQERERRQAKREIKVDPGERWSKARKAAEELFLPAAPRSEA
jgi:hypothetical protein